jgi:hypothetical protein
MHLSQWKWSLWAAALSLMLVVGCSSYSGGKGGSMAGNPHVAEAITHAQEAEDHGGKGHADEVVKHAEVSLQHAQAAKKEMSNPHLDAGIAELGQAIALGKSGDAAGAYEHAKSAGMHFKEIK